MHASRRKIAYLVVSAVVVIALIVVATTALTTTRSLRFDRSGVTYGGTPSRPHEVAVFSVPLENSKMATIELLSVTLIPVPGFPTPRLRHVALLGEDKTFPSGTTGWPPERGSPTLHYPIRDLVGAVVTVAPDNKPHQPFPIVEYGVVGAKPGTLYAVAGIELKYRLDGSVFTTPVMAGGFDCVIGFGAKPSKSQEKFCDQGYNAAAKAQWAMPLSRSVSPH